MVLLLLPLLLPMLVVEVVALADPLSPPPAVGDVSSAPSAHGITAAG